MCSMLLGDTTKSVGYATAALFKHQSALPFVNCVRLVAVARDDIEAVVRLTEVVILPYFIR